MRPTPLEIAKTSPREMMIRWNDGRVSVYSIHYLRSECMCARCVNEVTGLRIIDPRTISEDLTVTHAEYVGRYGIKFRFSDGHDDGIFTWERLRSLDKSLNSDTQPSPETNL
jgi:DUF971 family protein